MGICYEERYHSLWQKFLQITMVTSLSDEHYMDAMRVIHMLKLKYCDSMFESNQPFHHCKYTSFKSNEGSVVTQRKVPLSKSKMLIVKRIVKQATKKQLNKFLAKQKRRKN
jgi:hypothetical protein